jgi:phosphoribosylamine--glycine ligase
LKVLIVGSGGREYSIGLRLKEDSLVTEIFFAPGNGATDEIGQNIDIKDYYKLANFAKEEGVDLSIVGPENPLVDGIVDIFKESGLVIFGPSKSASRLEGSKVYMKNFLKKYNIPTASFIETNSQDEANRFIDGLDAPIVVKADGLCAGKGVIIAKSRSEAKEVVADMLSGKSFSEAGKRVVIEEFLDGYELSLFAICDGENFKLLPAAQDHKRLLDADQGPNTGGMGAYAPTPLVNDKIYQDVKDLIIRPTLDGMKKEGAPFEGVLFIGLMVVDGVSKVLEYNVRFGDPECEVLMPLIKSSPYELFYKAATKDLESLNIEIENRVGVCVVAASQNYPYSSSIPSEIIVDKIISDNLKQNAHISYAGVTKEDGKLFATGGRVLLGVGFGDTVKEARDNAYNILGQIHFCGKKTRSDIAYQALRVE